jgi:hypothetical protein
MTYLCLFLIIKKMSVWYDAIQFMFKSYQTLLNTCGLCYAYVEIVTKMAWLDYIHWIVEYLLYNYNFKKKLSRLLLSPNFMWIRF